MEDKTREIFDVEVVLQKTLTQTFAVNNRYDNKSLDYFFAHGLVFAILTKKYANDAEVKNYKTPQHGKILALADKIGQFKTNDRSQFVVISNVIRCEQTEGLQCFEQCIIDTVDGVKLKNLHHLMDLLNLEPVKGVHKLVLENGMIIMLEHLSPEKNIELQKFNKIPATQAPSSLIERHEKRKRKEENEASNKRRCIETHGLVSSRPYSNTFFESEVKPSVESANVDTVINGPGKYT